jgi:TatD DNase family protein
LVLPVHSSITSLAPTTSLIADTHTHILTTFSAYTSKYLTSAEIQPQHLTIKDFVRELVSKQGISTVVDVWCEAPMMMEWKEVVEQLVELKEEGFNYHFVAGCHPSEAELYDDALEEKLIEAHSSLHCCGWGEIGLVRVSLCAEFDLVADSFVRDYEGLSL